MYRHEREYTRSTKVVEVKKDTWKKLWDLKIDQEKPSLDTVIYEALTIYEMVLELAKVYNMDPILLVKEMVISYDGYLQRKLHRDERRGL